MNKPLALDHFGIVSRALDLYVAVGPYHPVGGYVAYRKYRLGSEGPWRARWGAVFDRTLAIYSPHSIDTGGELRKFYDPMLGSAVPLLPIDRVAKVIDPRGVAEKLLSRCWDELECLASELLADLVTHGMPLRCIGITGSLMFGIHVPKHSDIDIVVYGERCSEKALEVFPQVLEPLPRARAELVVGNVSAIHGLSRELAERCLVVPRRGVYRGVEVTIVLTWGSPWILRDPVRSWRCASIEIEVEPRTLGALMYPARFEARWRGEEIEVLSFESYLSIPMFFGGRFRVEGALQTLASGAKRIVLGCRECPSSTALAGAVLS